MIRFIDLRRADILGNIAFYDTITDSFVCFNGSYSWEKLDDFMNDACVDGYNTANSLKRFINLCPIWAKCGNYIYPYNWNLAKNPPIKDGWYLCLCRQGIVVRLMQCEYWTHEKTWRLPDRGQKIRDMCDGWYKKPWVVEYWKNIEFPDDDNTNQEPTP